MSHKVRIETVRAEHPYRYEEHFSTRLYINDQLIGEGSYGGEPEDNSIYRTYNWVEQMLSTLAIELGAEVEHTEVKEVW